MGLRCGEGAAVRAQLSSRNRHWRNCEGSLGMGGVRSAARTPRLCPRPAGSYVALGRGPSSAEATGPEGAAWVPGVEVPLRSRFPRQSGLSLSPRSPSSLTVPP